MWLTTTVADGHRGAFKNRGQATHLPLQPPLRSSPRAKTVFNEPLTRPAPVSHRPFAGQGLLRPSQAINGENHASLGFLFRTFHARSTGAYTHPAAIVGISSASGSGGWRRFATHTASHHARPFPGEAKLVSHPAAPQNASCFLDIHGFASSRGNGDWPRRPDSKNSDNSTWAATMSRRRFLLFLPRSAPAVSSSFAKTVV